MSKIGKDILERAIKTGMKSVGFSGTRVDRRAIEALRDAKLGKLLSKKSVEQNQVYAALEALKKKGLISGHKDLKFLVKKSMTEERKQEQREKFEKRVEVTKQELHERTAKEYISERREEETSGDRGEAARARLGSIREVTEEKGKFTASKPVRASISEIGRASKEEKSSEVPPSSAKDLPI